MKNSSAIGIIGIGVMGMAIARNLYRKGYDVAVRDIRPEAEREAHSAGMMVYASPAALAVAANLIVIVVVNAQQIDDVLFGADGLTRADAKGKAVVICSTIAPEDMIRFGLRLKQHGIATIDAPISGGPARAEAGTMSMMIAGNAATIAQWGGVLAAMAEKRFDVSGNIGDGSKAKLVNNLLAGINLVAGAEALALGMKIGLDPQKLFEIISVSSGSSWVFQDRMARVLQDDFVPRAFAHILTKDLTLATAMADAVQYHTPLGDAALVQFQETLKRGWAELDDAAVIKTYQK